jgi:hypothetical protein
LLRLELRQPELRQRAALAVQLALLRPVQRQRVLPALREARAPLQVPALLLELRRVQSSAY